MKYRLLFIALLLSLFSQAQLKHYLSYNGVAFTNFFNKEKDKVFSKTVFAPCLNYKVEKNRIGIEAFFNYPLAVYYPDFSIEFVPDSSIQQIISYNLGVAFHYNILTKTYLKINPFLGILKNWYDATFLNFWFGSPPWSEPYTSYHRESKIGLVTGVNINVPVYKNIYTNANVRYSVFPTALYNKQNLILEVGFGYMIQRKKR